MTPKSSSIASGKRALSLHSHTAVSRSDQPGASHLFAQRCRTGSLQIARAVSRPRLLLSGAIPCPVLAGVGSRPSSWGPWGGPSHGPLCFWCLCEGPRSTIPGCCTSPHASACGLYLFLGDALKGCEDPVPPQTFIAFLCLMITAGMHGFLPLSVTKPRIWLACCWVPASCRDSWVLPPGDGPGASGAASAPAAWTLPLGKGVLLQMEPPAGRELGPE